MATMNISLPEKLKDFVDAEVESRGFGNVSEYMRQLIRNEKEHAESVLELQALLDEGEASGFEIYDRGKIEKRLDMDKRKKNAA